MASGVSKHRVVKELLAGGINTDIPASMLKLHSQVILVCDKAAYSSERIGVYVGGTDMIVLSGGITNAGDDFLRPIVEKYKSNIPVVISTLKSDACVVGAAMM